MRLLVVVVVLAFVTAVGPASADAQPKPQARALDLAYEGDALFAKGEWEAAYQRFAAADALAHSPVFVLYMARARRNAGKLLEAITIYRKVAGESLAADAPAPFRAALADAAAELAATEKQVPRIRVDLVRVPDGAVPIVKIDGATVDPGAATRVDPGRHRVTVVRAGAPDVVRDVVVTDSGEESQTTIDLGPGAARPARAGSLAPGVLGLVIGGVGVDLGIVTGAVSIALGDEVKKGCIDGHCLARDADKLSTARALATTSTVAFIVGGVGVATGLVLVAVRPGGDDGPVEITAGPAGMNLRGSF